MLNQVLETVSRHNMLPPGSRVIAAVSGGADSVCLLYVLRELFPAAVAGVAHFNHKWRPGAADQDERFVAELAARFSLPFFRAEGVPAPGNLEQNARRARLAFFSTLGATVALGHNRDDQAETVLFRILRGSGLAGLSGIAPATNGIIRPLLDVTRAEIEEFLRSRNIPWREDSTNQDTRFARNRIRHNLLPQLARDWNPQIGQSLARLADLAGEEEQYWKTQIDRIAETALVARPGGVELRASVLAELPRPLARRLIRRAVSEAKGDLRGMDFHHVESILDLKRSARIPGLTVTRSFDWIRFAVLAEPAEPGAIQIHGPGTYQFPAGSCRISIEAAEANPCATLRLERCLPLELRGWRSGDRYRPQGYSRDRKIQEMFQKARVPSWRRASWPILVTKDGIVWARAFGVAEQFAGALVVREVALS